MEFCEKPSRSDARLSREEELETEDKTREYFSGLTPPRHTKPSRSEYSSLYVDGNQSNEPIPELAEFQRLEKDSAKIVYDGGEIPEEFVETEYYGDLNCIDKEHHTTGTGFIKVEDAGGAGFYLGPDCGGHCHGSCKGNPATNDWVPAAVDDWGTFSSGKPKRSEN